jgi:hypothetical protein
VPVIKVVGLVTGNPKHFSLYFSDFLVMFSGFYKLQIETTLYSLVSYKQVPGIMHGGL